MGSLTIVLKSRLTKYFVAIVLICVSIVAFQYVDLGLGLLRISLAVNIYPTVDALDKYLHETLEPGMSRKEINSELYKLGRVRIDESDRIYQGRIGPCDFVVVWIGYWPLNSLEYSVCYNADLQLESIDLLDSD